MSCAALVEHVLTRHWSTGWVDTVKTGHQKELPPQNIDWYVDLPKSHLIRESS